MKKDGVDRIRKVFKPEEIVPLSQSARFFREAKLIEWRIVKRMVKCPYCGEQTEIDTRQLVHWCRKCLKTFHTRYEQRLVVEE
jgi:transposase-like protein